MRLDSHTIAEIATRRWGGNSVRFQAADDLTTESRASVILEPLDSAAAADMLQWADAERLSIVSRGAGTKIEWGSTTTRADAILSTARLKNAIDHRSGDLTATIPAGWPLREANRILASERQWLPLDPAFHDRATVGGIVATNDSGPRRQRYGAPRDLIIGVEMALADGRMARAGGRVVKNVAGYDLMRLLCGSFGSLAVITSATFKLSPIAPLSRTVVATVPLLDKLAPLAQAISAGSFVPSAVELESSPPRLFVRFEGPLRSSDEQAASVKQICESAGAAVDILADETETDLWQQHDRYIWGEADGERLDTGQASHDGPTRGTASDGRTTVKVSLLPTGIGPLLGRFATAMSARNVSWRAGGRAALGILFVVLTGDSDTHADAIIELRRETVDLGGTAVVLGAHPDIRSRIDPWGDIGDALPLMRSVKAQFDPNGILNPGRGPGGL